MITDSAAVRQILGASETIGARLPKEVLAAHARMTKLTEAADHLPNGLELAAVVADAIEADRDPLEDPAVLRVVVAGQIGAAHMPRVIGEIGYDRFRAVCLEHADDIVSSWRKVFDQAAMALTAAFDRLGDIDIDDASAVLGKGGDAAEQWAAAQRAKQTISSVVAAWVSLGAFIRAVSLPADRRHIGKRIADLDYQQHRDLEDGLTPWSAIVHGVPLSLPTFAGYRARLAAWQQAESEPEMVVDRERSAIAGREVRVPTQ